MKKTLLFISFISLIAFSSQAQDFRGTDKSSMDMAYYPDNFAHDRKGSDEALVRVIYSRPKKNDREIFGKLESYGKVWRTGANENTEIKLYKDATVAGKKLKAGTYSLFTIPGESEWTIIFSSALDYWGAYSYKEDKDVLRVTVPSKKVADTIEYFSIVFAKSGTNGATMSLGWDKTVVDVPFTF
ncbi:MAG: DUF2911 domain-containing protein [Imperialibacter sp.]|uniref:DUF2911 domain-containing protein n=1 Tax=Imperialibacter sp. TaxID=2038411 RepID=UPI0032EB766B